MSQPFFLARKMNIPNAARRTAMGTAMAMPNVVTEIPLLEGPGSRESGSTDVSDVFIGFVDVEEVEEEEGRARADCL